MTIEINSINAVHLAGKVCNDPVVEDKNDSQSCIIILRLKEKFHKQGEWIQNSFFVRVVYFGKICEAIPKFAKRGDMVYCHAKIRQWHKEGEKHPITQFIGVNAPTKMANRDEQYYENNENNPRDYEYQYNGE